MVDTTFSSGTIIASNWLNYVNDKANQTLSVEADFGAVGDGVTDDTVAVQAAITYCVTNNINLEVPGICKITGTLNIDRPFLAMANPQLFTIFSNSGGGFLFDTPGTLFSSTISYTSDPVSHLIRFEGLWFKGGTAYNTTAAYVLSSSLFRVIFDSCTFESIKCLTAPSKYTQSHHFYDCNVRGFNGTFYSSQNATYDLKVIGGIYEDSYGNLWDINIPSGCSFTGACMEGMKTNNTQLGTVLRYSNANGLAVHGCYIEGNEDYDIEWVTGTSYGISVLGNIFSHSLRAQTDITSGRWYQIQTVGTTNWTALGASAGTVGTVFQYNGAAITGTGGVAYEFSIKWGTCDGCVSAGNFHTQAMHELASDSNVMVNDYSQAALVNRVTPFRMQGASTFQRSAFMSKRTDGGYQWTFGEGASGSTAKHFSFTCESTSATPWLDINGDTGGFGFGAENPDAANGGTTLYMRKAGATAPTTTANGGYVYVASDGTLKYKSPGGTVTQLAPN